MAGAGSAINTYKIPQAFWLWFEGLQKKYPYTTIEWSGQQITICRIRVPVEDERSIEDLPFGKITRDASGCYLERTFKPRYFPDEDAVRTVA